MENSIVPGLYYRPTNNRFQRLGEPDWPMVVDPLVDSFGIEWRLVSQSLIDWMAEKIEAAFRNPNVTEEDIGAAILKFYAVREALEKYRDQCRQFPAVERARRRFVG